MRISTSSAESRANNNIYGAIFENRSYSERKRIDNLDGYYMWEDYRRELKGRFSYGEITESTDKFGQTWLCHGFTGGAEFFLVNKIQ